MIWTDKKKEDLYKNIKGLLLPQKKEVIEICLTEAMCTKNKNWNEAEYFNGVINPVNKVKGKYKELHMEPDYPQDSDVHEALDMIDSVFYTKKVPQEEAEVRLVDILNITYKERKL